MSITKEYFGSTKDQVKVDRYSLSNKDGIVVRVLTYGGCIQSVLVPGTDGLKDITTGYDSITEYELNPAYFGAVIGRWANRIHKGTFEVDGVKYNVAINNGPNHLHGGIIGWDKKVWEATVNEHKLVLHYVSVDGEEGYPGTVTACVTYQLNDDNELVIQYSATTDQATPINLTNHAYFNLAGHKAANIYDHTIQLQAKSYTPKNEDDVPSGEIASVSGTLYDLQERTCLGERIPQILADNVGFDINYCVDGKGEKKLAARVEHAASGRSLEVYTNMPGIQLYTANFLAGEPGKDGALYGKHSCLALETQNYPDAINKPNFPTSILRAGETYDHKCWYKFGQPL